MPSAFLWPVLVPCALRAPAPVNLGVIRSEAWQSFALTVSLKKSTSAIMRPRQEQELALLLVVWLVTLVQALELPRELKLA